MNPIFYIVGSGDDDSGLSNATIAPAVHATVSSGSSKIPPGKVPRKYASFDDLVDIERANALLKQENLKLKQKKLKLEIELLERKLNASTPKDDSDSPSPVYFNL